MSSKDWSQVRVMLEKQMPKSGYDQASIDGALQLWNDFLETNPKWRKPGIYAAGVEYCIVQMSFSQRTQMQVAQAYGVSVASLASAYKRIWDDLSLSRFNSPYVSSLSANAGPMAQLRSLLMSGAFGFTMPEPMQWKHEQRRLLKAMPQKQCRWSLLLVPSAVMIEEAPDQVFNMALLYDDETKEVMDSLLIDMERIELDEFRSIFFEQCQRRGGRPTTLVCTNEAVMDGLVSAMLKIGVEVSYLPDHESEVVRQFRLLHEVDQPSFVRDSGGQIFAHLDEFLRQGQRMLALEPWTIFEPNEALCMAHRTLNGCIVLMGHDQQVFGMSIFESLEHVRQLHVKDPSVFDQPDAFREMREQMPRVLSVTRFDYEDLNQCTLDDLKSQGFAVERGGSIALPMVTQGAVSSADILYLTQILAAMNEVLEDRYLESDGAYYVRVGRKRIKIKMELIVVTQKDESFNIHDDIHPSEEQKYHHYESQLLLRFDESDEASAFKAEGGEPYLLGVCLEMSFVYLDVLLPHIEAYAFEELCFDVLPRKLTIEDVDGRLFQKELLAFWAFLDKSFGIKNPKVLKVLKSPSFVTRFESSMNDSQNWGLAKTFAMGGEPSLPMMFEPSSPMILTSPTSTKKKKTAGQKKKKRKQAKTSRSKNRKKKKK